MKHLLAFLTGAIVVFVLVAPAMAQRELSGMVVREKRIDVEGLASQNRIILMKTTDGHRVIVDLGPVEQTDETDVAPGKKIQVTGNLVRISYRPVFLAQQITVDGYQTFIDQPYRAGFATEKKQVSLEKIWNVSGTVIREKRVSIEGSTRNRIILLRIGTGEQVVTDLGPAVNAVPVQRGQTLEVRGKLFRVGNQLILAADRITMDDRTIRVKRLP